LILPLREPAVILQTISIKGPLSRLLASLFYGVVPKSFLVVFFLMILVRRGLLQVMTMTMLASMATPPAIGSNLRLKIHISTTVLRGPHLYVTIKEVRQMQSTCVVPVVFLIVIRTSFWLRISSPLWAFP
jgi:hypothetical protein